jgi:hypothetical protein
MVAAAHFNTKDSMLDRVMIKKFMKGHPSNAILLYKQLSHLLH